MLDVRETALPGVLEIRAPRFADDRGFFTESWNRETWRGAGIDLDFVQDNHSLSRDRGTIRGLHFQVSPAAQDKLVRVTRGSVFDVAVDVRRESTTFGKWVGVTLSAAEGNQLLIPKGYAHGFQTLEPDTEFQYKVTSLYSPAHDRAIRFDDPDIAIVWPIGDIAVLSDKDRAAPSFAMMSAAFE